MRSSYRSTLHAPGFDTTSCWRISFASSSRRSADEVPSSIRRAAQWSADHGDVVESVRHTLRPATGRGGPARRGPLVQMGARRRAGTIDACSRRSRGRIGRPSWSALADAAAELNDDRLDEAAAQLTLADRQRVQSADPAQRRTCGSNCIAAIGAGAAQRSVHGGDRAGEAAYASIADDEDDAIAMDSELRAVALVNLGIVETWSGRPAEAERHLSEGAELAGTIGRPYLEVAGRAHQGFPSRLTRLRPRASAVVRPWSSPTSWPRGSADTRAALGAVAGMAYGLASSTKRSAGCSAPGTSPRRMLTQPTAVLLHVTADVVRWPRRASLGTRSIVAAAQAQSRLTGVHGLAPWITGWLRRPRLGPGRRTMRGQPSRDSGRSRADGSHSRVARFSAL